MRSAVLNPLPLILLVFAFCVSDSRAGQISASFRFPVLGYVLDSDLHAIRPIAGILGSSRIEEPIDLGVAIHDAVFLLDHRHAIVISAETKEALVANLEPPFGLSRIAGAPSSVSMIRTSGDGTKAALYYRQTNQLLVVGGLPESPAVLNSIPVSLEKFSLKRFAISDDGAVALLAFAGAESDALYIWTSNGLRFLTNASRISDIAFIDADAVMTDSVADQVVLIRSVREQASPALIADSSNGIAAPVAVSVSSSNEIYVANADAVSVISASGSPLRRIACDCRVTILAPLRDFAVRLTGQLDQPLWVLDGEPRPERILFVPALAPKPPEVNP